MASSMTALRGLPHGALAKRTQCRGPVDPDQSEPEEPGDDDCELDETPEDVVEMLGFDPKLERGG